MESPMGTENPRASPMASRNLAANPEKDRRDGQKDGNELGLAHPSGQEPGKGIVQDALLPYSPENIPGAGLSGAVGGAVIAVMAQPDIRVRKEAILHPPESPGHLFSRKRVDVRGERTCGGTVPALHALLQGVAAASAQGPE